MISDTHMHTRAFSSDAKQTIEGLISSAKAKGILVAAITEHYDMDYPHKDEVFTFDLNEYGNIFPKWRDLSKQMNGPELLMGIEIGWQPHLNDRIKETVRSLPFDMVVLSDHLFRGTDVYYSTEAALLPRAERNKEYIGSLARMCREIDDFDTVAHYDYINRYIDDPDSAVFYRDCSDEFDDLFSTLIRKDKALEINTSSIGSQINKKAEYIMPDPDIIRRYIQMGGKLITIGSDAHTSDKIGQLFDRTALYLKSLGVHELFYYKNRKPVSDPEYASYF